MVGLGEQFVHSELFGHTKGSYTGATEARNGIIQEFDGGTIFFDEIDKLELTVQAKLLRYLETQEYSKLGENKLNKSDCRFIFATSKNLLELVKDGRFLLDLYYRITGAVVNLPSLKEIMDGNPEIAHSLFNFFHNLLCQNYGDKIGSDEHWQDILMETDHLRLWFEYEWHGNFREFINYMKRNLILRKWGDLPDSKKENDDSYNINIASTPNTTFLAFSQIEKDYITKLMKNVNGIKKRASDVSGLSLSTINRKLKEYNIL